MPQPYSICSLWPGLPGLVRYGRAPFLWISLTFALWGAAIFFVCGFWTEWIPFSLKIYGFIALVGVWFGLTFLAGKISAYYDRQAAYDRSGGRFLDVLDAYLAGDWEKSLRGVTALLERNPRDPEALLFSATLSRHRGQYDRAAASLELLSQQENSHIWRYEISQEWVALSQARKESEVSATDSDSEEPEILSFPDSETSQSISLRQTSA